MTIDEAIKTLSNLVVASQLVGGTRQDTAIKLGIEALKRLKTIRGYPYFQLQGLLPGETKD